jgi:hypothetical protein
VGELVKVLDKARKSKMHDIWTGPWVVTEITPKKSLRLRFEGDSEARGGRAMEIEAAAANVSPWKPGRFAADIEAAAREIREMRAEKEEKIEEKGEKKAEKKDDSAQKVPEVVMQPENLAEASAAPSAEPMELTEVSEREIGTAEKEKELEKEKEMESRKEKSATEKRKAEEIQQEEAAAAKKAKSAADDERSARAERRRQKKDASAGKDSVEIERIDIAEEKYPLEPISPAEDFREAQWKSVMKRRRNRNQGKHGGSEYYVIWNTDLPGAETRKPAWMIEADTTHKDQREMMRAFDHALREIAYVDLYGKPKKPAESVNMASLQAFDGGLAPEPIAEGMRYLLMRWALVPNHCQ